MYDRPLIVALRASLADLVATQPSVMDDATQQQLHTDVCAVVNELKGEGWPPERIIIAVKEITRDAGLHPSRSILLNGSELIENDALLADIVRWCIERYFGFDVLPGLPSYMQEHQ